MLQWDSTSIVILLCVTKYAISGKSQEVDLFQLFSPDFSHLSCFLLSYLLHHFLSLLNFFFLTFGSSSSFPSACLPFPSAVSFRWNWYSFFALKCFHPCLQDLNNSLTQFISGCCCLAVLQEATVAPVLVTNIGKCKVRKVFGSVTFSGCVFWNMCKDPALQGTSAWTAYGMSICSILLKEEF